MPIKLGRIPYLNSEVFYQESPLDLLEVRTHVPAALAHAARKGEVDLAPLPTVACFDLEDSFAPLGEYCIATKDKAWSVLLFSKRPIEELDGRVVARTGESATSVKLLKVLFAKRFGVTPERYVSTQEPNDALILIGDAALRNRKGLPSYSFQYDLGEMWHDWTGLPFVFARWVIRKTIDPGMVAYLANMLERSIEIGLSRLDAIARQRSDLGMTEAEVREYFEGYVFRIGEKETEALDRFRGLLVEVGEMRPAAGKPEAPVRPSTEKVGDRATAGKSALAGEAPRA
jgi:chorismate dehydratase